MQPESNHEDTKPKWKDISTKYLACTLQKHQHCGKQDRPRNCFQLLILIDLNLFLFIFLFIYLRFFIYSFIETQRENESQRHRAEVEAGSMQRA